MKIINNQRIFECAITITSLNDLVNLICCQFIYFYETEFSILNNSLENATACPVIDLARIDVHI